MALKFKCPVCTEKIVTHRYVGELASCPNCGTESFVPGSARETKEDPGCWETPHPSKPKLRPASTVGPHSHRATQARSPVGGQEASPSSSPELRPARGTGPEGASQYRANGRIIAGRNMHGYPGPRGAGAQRIGNMTLYFMFLFGGLVLCIAGGAAMEENEDVGSVLIGFGAIAIVAAVVYFLVLLYRLWRFVIHESLNSDLIPSIETPGKAVGYCFIPFYNYYWVFKAIGRLPKDLNSLARARGVSRSMSENLGTAISILVLVGIIPYVGYLTGATNFFILYPVFVTQAVGLCRDVSAAAAVTARADKCLTCRFSRPSRASDASLLICSHMNMGVTRDYYCANWQAK